MLYRILCGDAFNIGKYAESLKWGVKAVFTHPSALGYIALLAFRKLKRNATRRNVPPEYKVAVEKFLKN